MKAVLLLILASASSFWPAAADNEAPPDLEVVKASWNKFQYRAVFTPPRPQRGSARPIPADGGTNGSGPGEPRTAEPPAPFEMPRIGRLHNGFQYHVTLRNTGKKVIESVDYEYLFIDPNTQKVASRHRFSGGERMDPGKQKKLTHFRRTPPTFTVSADNLNKPFIERVLIKRIVYADGTIWQLKAEQQSP